MASIPAADPAATCARCRRPAHHLESWLERRRLRTPSAQAGGFAYSHRIVEHLVCSPCYAEVRAGRSAVVHNAYRVLGLAVLGVALMAASLPIVMPNLLAAFWQNGAAPSGWREHHLQGRPAFIQGRY